MYIPILDSRPTIASWSAPLYTSDKLLVTGRHIVCTRIRRSPINKVKIQFNSKCEVQGGGGGGCGDMKLWNHLQSLPYLPVYMFKARYFNKVCDRWLQYVNTEHEKISRSLLSIKFTFILIISALPLLDVYSSAAWKQAVLFSNVSSIDICIPNPASGLIFGKDKRSVDRTKKFPWKVCILNPVKTKYKGYHDVIYIYIFIRSFLSKLFSICG